MTETVSSKRTPLLTENEVATWLGVTLPGLRHMRQRGHAPTHIKIGQRRLAYREQDVLSWLDKRAVNVRVPEIAEAA